jgi:carbon storage regulator CsrA
MPVLPRRIDEELLIAGNVRMTVVAVKGKRARLDVTAPSSVPVTRLEVFAECSEDLALQP